MGWNVGIPEEQQRFPYVKPWFEYPQVFNADTRLRIGTVDAYRVPIAIETRELNFKNSPRTQYAITL